MRFSRGLDCSDTRHAVYIYIYIYIYVCVSVARYIGNSTLSPIRPLGNLAVSDERSIDQRCCISIGDSNVHLDVDAPEPRGFRFNGP